MTRPRLLSSGVLTLAIVCGTLADTPVERPPLVLDGYRVLEADFHVHAFPLSAGTIAPWDLVFEARRQGLDALAVAGHNETLSGKAAQWTARHFGGPIVLASEEIHGPIFHMIAAGIHSTVSWRLSASDAIDEIHRQGGVAIAAHPTGNVWRAFNGTALSKLDASEVLQPVAWSGEDATLQLRKFYVRFPVAPVASSDYHGLGPIGLCRTYVFAREATEAGVLDALREHHTVVFDRDRSFGDPALIALATAAGLPRPLPNDSALAVLSRVLAIGGLAGLILSQSSARGC